MFHILIGIVVLSFWLTMVFLITGIWWEVAMTYLRSRRIRWSLLSMCIVTALVAVAVSAIRVEPAAIWLLGLTVLAVLTFVLIGLIYYVMTDLKWKPIKRRDARGILGRGEIADVAVSLPRNAGHKGTANRPKPRWKVKGRRVKHNSHGMY